jgi:hypothetical protein
MICQNFVKIGAVCGEEFSKEDVLPVVLLITSGMQLSNLKLSKLFSARLKVPKTIDIS